MRFFLILFIILFYKTYSQTNDDEARILYSEAQEAYEAHDYVKTENLLLRTFNKLGKTNPTIEYLHIKALYDGTQNNTWPANMDNYKMIMLHIDTLLSLIDKHTYPQEKYDEVLKIKLDMEEPLAEMEAAGKRIADAATAMVEQLTKIDRIKLGVTTEVECIQIGGYSKEGKSSDYYFMDNSGYYVSSWHDKIYKVTFLKPWIYMPYYWIDAGLRGDMTYSQWVAALKNLNFRVSESDDNVHKQINAYININKNVFKIGIYFTSVVGFDKNVAGALSIEASVIEANK